MTLSSTTVLDQIEQFFILLSGDWFTFNASCDHTSQLSTWLGIDEDDYKKLLIAANLAWYKGRGILHCKGWVEILIAGIPFVHELIAEIPLPV
jgi:hypothetical protein